LGCYVSVPRVSKRFLSHEERPAKPTKVQNYFFKETGSIPGVKLTMDDVRWIPQRTSPEAIRKLERIEVIWEDYCEYKLFLLLMHIYLIYFQVDTTSKLGLC
jgi:hypothetical protein